MDPPFKEEVVWDPVDVDATGSDAATGTDRRHSSSASSSTLSTSDSNDPSSARGRRSRPSVASASSQLPTVREKKEQRALSLDKPPSLVHFASEETVVSSQKVGPLAYFASVRR